MYKEELHAAKCSLILNFYECSKLGSWQLENAKYSLKSKTQVMQRNHAWDSSVVCPRDVANTVDEQTQIPTDFLIKAPKLSWLLFKMEASMLKRRHVQCDHTVWLPDVYSIFPRLLGEKEENERSRLRGEGCRGGGKRE